MVDQVIGAATRQHNGRGTADGELGEDLAPVVLDGARADEQPGTDLRVGQALAGLPPVGRLRIRQWLVVAGV